MVPRITPHTRAAQLGSIINDAAHNENRFLSDSKGFAASTKTKHLYTLDFTFLPCSDNLVIDSSIFYRNETSGAVTVVGWGSLVHHGP